MAEFRGTNLHLEKPHHLGGDQDDDSKEEQDQRQSQSQCDIHFQHGVVPNRKIAALQAQAPATSWAGWAGI